MQYLPSVLQFFLSWKTCCKYCKKKKKKEKKANAHTYSFKEKLKVQVKFLYTTLQKCTQLSLTFQNLPISCGYCRPKCFVIWLLMICILVFSFFPKCIEELSSKIQFFLVLKYLILFVWPKLWPKFIWLVTISKQKSLFFFDALSFFFVHQQ